MQALKSDLWIEPQLGSETSSCLDVKSRNRRKMIWGFESPVLHGRNSTLSLLASGNSRAVWYGNLVGGAKFDLGFGFSSGFSRLKVAHFWNRTSSLGASASTALASERQATGNEAQLEGSEREEEEEELEERPGKNDGWVNVRELASSLRHAVTADQVDEILGGKGDLPLRVYSTVIRGLGKEKLLGPAFALFEWIKRRKEDGLGPNLFIYNSLLGAIKQSGEFGLAERVLDEMSRDGIAPNIVTYNTKMAILLCRGMSDEALEVLGEIREKGLVPSPASYSTAMLAYRRTEDPNGALKFLADVRDKYRNGEMSEDRRDLETELAKLEGFAVRICYQAMRNWLASEDNLSTKVLKLLTSMDTAGIPPGRSDHEKLIWACTREDHAVVAKELYDRIRERGSAISLSACNHAMWVMGRAKRWWTALEIYEDLLEKGPKPNQMSDEIIVAHFNVLLGSARKRGIWKWAVRLLNKMEEKGLKPGSREWDAALVACSKASEPAVAVEIFERMIERGQKPTRLSYSSLLSALEKGKLYDEARTVYEHMVKVGLGPDLYASTIMASAFAAQGKPVLVDAILRDMARGGVEPGVVTWNAVVAGFAKSGAASAAFEWFRKMECEDGVEPNGVTYGTLVEALAKDSKPRMAYEIYVRAHKEGLEPGPRAYDALVESARANKASLDLTLLGPRPPDNKNRKT